jgi:predicted nucleic acid-binding Zn ribbon protein
MELTKRICVVCGKEFWTTRSNQITCSKECSKENNRRQSRLRYKAEQELNKQLLKDGKGYERDCVVCGKHFRTLIYSKITCGMSCYNKIRGKHREDYIQEKPHINRMDEIREIARHGIHYGFYVVEMEKENEVSRKG